jgi:hypothetical protein
VPLVWNDKVVEPTGFTPGELIDQQGGLGLVLSPCPGTVDAAIMGVRDRGISGEGLLATVTFRIKAEGDPGIELGEILGRDKANERVEISGELAGETLPVPQVSTLGPNVPNPFNPSTELSFALSRAGDVRLRIYSLQGRLVRTLVQGELPEGQHSVTWHGRDDAGRTVASGSYIVRLEAPDRSQSRRITLLK